MEGRLIKNNVRIVTYSQVTEELQMPNFGNFFSNSEIFGSVGPRLIKWVSLNAYEIRINLIISENYKNNKKKKMICSDGHEIRINDTPSFTGFRHITIR